MGAQGDPCRGGGLNLRPRLRRAPVESLTLWDRLVYACMSALVSAGIGGLVGFCLMFLEYTHGFSRPILAFSVAFFFGVGFLKGPAAGDFAGEAVAYAIEAASEASNDAARTAGPSFLWLWICYAAGVLVLVWAL
jgi:hypothetical protein